MFFFILFLAIFAFVSDIGLWLLIGFVFSIPLYWVFLLVVLMRINSVAGEESSRTYKMDRYGFLEAKSFKPIKSSKLVVIYEFLESFQENLPMGF